MKTKQGSNRISLMAKFLLLSISILLLFVFIVIFSLIELTDYDVFTNNITNSSMPKIIKTLNTHSTTKEFAYLVDKFTESNSKIAKKVVHKEIKKKMDSIKEFELKMLDRTYIKDKFANIEQEFKNLNILIDNRLVLQDKITARIGELDDLNELFIKTFSHEKAMLWNIKYLKNIAISSRINRIEKIKELPQLKSIVDKNFIFLYDKMSTKKEQKFIDKLAGILLGRQGLFALKKDDFQVKKEINRARILTRSLIENFSNEIKYLSIKENEKLVYKVQESSKKLEIQIKFLILFFIFCLLYLFGVIFYFRKTIIQRLVRLDRNIYERLKGGKEIIEDDGKDEISYITQSFNFFASKVEKQNLKLQELALTDGLTNIANRRLFDIKFEDEMKYIKRLNYPSSIFIIDVDNFKLFNDEYGHIAGDNCLKKIAIALQYELKRDIDFVARYGGEEFTCILSNTNINQSKVIAKRLVEVVEELQIPHAHNGKYLHVTISVGIKTIFKQECELGKENIKRADQALYKAKREGKNRYIHYDDGNLKRYCE